jgi:hypothetical protein
MKTPRRLLLSAAILTVLLSCGRAADLTSKQRVDIGRIYGAKSKNPSSADVQACLDFGRGISEWNRITAPVVRDLLDPQVTKEEWARSTTTAMPQMRAVVMKMLANARLVSDEGIAKTLLPLAAVHREMLDAYTLIAFAMNAGEKEKVAELTSGLRTLGEKKTALGISVVQRTREYLGPESFDKALDEHVKVSSSSTQNAEMARTVDQSSPEAQSSLGLNYALPGKQLQLSSLDWVAMQNEENYAKNFESRHVTKDEMFPQVVTVFLTVMSPDRRIGTRISDSEHLQFFTGSPGSVTVQVRREKQEYWILSRQTFALNGTSIEHNYSEADITQLRHRFQNEIDRTRLLLSETF